MIARYVLVSHSSLQNRQQHAFLPFPRSRISRVQCLSACMFTQRLPVREREEGTRAGGGERRIVEARERTLKIEWNSFFFFGLWAIHNFFGNPARALRHFTQKHSSE